MPRQAHGRSLLRAGPSRPPKRKPQRGAALNALETAEKQTSDSIKIRQHRLGEVEDDSDVPETRVDADGHSNKRRKVTNEQEEEDDVEEGSDLEGGTWHVGVDNDDEDSDLDSDEAFGESDEEKFADFTFRGSGAAKSQARSTKRKATKELDLEEDRMEGSEIDSDGNDEDDDLGDEAIDLTAAWDMADTDEPDPNKAKAKSSGRNLTGAHNLSDSESSNATSDGESSREEATDTESQFSVSDDELGGDNAGLRTFVERISSTKLEKEQQHKPSESRSLPQQPSRTGLTSSKLSVADLMPYVKDPVQRQSLKLLSNAEHTGSTDYRGGIPGKLSAPLARRQQDKLDRAAAYEQSKESLNKWIDTVKQNRRAEHLSFPLADHAKESVLGQKQLMPTSQSAPVTELEATINNIMQESGMGNVNGQSTEEQEQAFEELAEKKMDIDAVKARRAELRMARELMFREEIRAKRIKKIKSRAFRRVHRKEKDRIEAQQREALAAAGLLNSDEEREKQDRRRAEERMGARHRESKWAKGVKQIGRAGWDEDVRTGVTDLAKRDEELRKRILGKDINEGSDLESGSESDIDTETEDQAFNEKLNKLESAGNATSKSKLGQMAFMQRAEAARKAANDEEIRQLRLAMDDRTNDVVASEDKYQEPSGRQKFGTQASAKTVVKPRKLVNEFEAPISSEDDNNEKGMSPVAADKTGNSTRDASSDEFKKSGERQTSRPTKLSEVRRVSLGSQRIVKDAKKSRVKGSEMSQMMLDEYTSSSESEDDSPKKLDADSAKAALAASIFAGPDDTVYEFEKEKAELVEEEGDQIINNTLPGWGSWTGAGISKREQKKNKGRFVTTIKGVAPEKRQDAKLDRVIINEKRVKKNGKYLATELPHPYENRQQYERSLRLPIGPEWSTANHYQDSIKPRVLLKQGTVIRPIAKPVA